VNYYELPEGFMKSAVINMVSGRTVNWETLSAATSGFTDIDIEITMNGIELDPVPFLHSIRACIEHTVKDRLNELVRDAGLTDLADAVTAVEQVVKQELYARMAKLGVDMFKYED